MTPYDASLPKVGFLAPIVPATVLGATLAALGSAMADSPLAGLRPFFPFLADATPPAPSLLGLALVLIAEGLPEGYPDPGSPFLLETLKGALSPSSSGVALFRLVLGSPSLERSIDDGSLLLLRALGFLDIPLGAFWGSA
jgi:hypothetical protein